MGADAVQRDTTSDGRDALVAALAERQAASAPPESPATSAVSQPRQVVVIDSSVPDYRRWSKTWRQFQGRGGRCERERFMNQPIRFRPCGM